MAPPKPSLRIGFIGLGTMGFPMAGHLATAAHSLQVFDLEANLGTEFVELHPNATTTNDLADVGIDADVIITMLPDGKQVQQVAETVGPSLPSGCLWLDTSSAQPWLTLETAKRLMAHGVAMVDAPVSGAQWGAEAADLVFMVGGELNDVARIHELLTLLGPSIFHVGPLGSGHKMKSINNMITAMTFLATSEGLALGAKAGLDPAAMNQVLNHSTGSSWITQNHIKQRILSRTFDDPFKLDLMVKDIDIASQLARDNDLPIPFSELGEQLYLQAQHDADQDASVSELARWVERVSGTEIAPK